MTAGDLRKRKWKRFLRASDGTLLEELYEPALAEAVSYDRCCAYFSSTALAAAARGFGRLIERIQEGAIVAHRVPVRLLVNEEMNREDVRALTEYSDTGVLERMLLARLQTPVQALERQRLEMLALMVQRGWLQLRVGIMRTSGILHAKYGIIRDGLGNAIVFRGSSNETHSGLRQNYDQLEVSTSWQDREALDYFSSDFEALWSNKATDVETYPLPEAVRLKLIKFVDVEGFDASKVPVSSQERRIERQKAAMIWRFIVEAPYLENGASACDGTAMLESVWPHQQRVVDEVSSAWPDGRLLCDEVGMGKTVETILILRRLLAGRGVRRVLILLPAGLLRQWQAELREKGGLVFPRLQGNETLLWPDGSEQRVGSLGEALQTDVLLMSREFARLENNRAVILASEPWDLVLLDESHAARRKKAKEGEFNSGNLILDLLRLLQLREQARAIILLSATPMQTQPWEPWDLLGVLGEGSPWLTEFRSVRDYYTAMTAVSTGRCVMENARPAAAVIIADANYPRQLRGAPLPLNIDGISKRLVFTPLTGREELAEELRCNSPLVRRMHRNTRATLRDYYRLGLLDSTPPVRRVEDIAFNYATKAERDIYDSLTHYIERRFRELEEEKPGKGFVMTIYRRRVASSLHAIAESLRRRRQGLHRVIMRHAHQLIADGGDLPEGIDLADLGEDDETGKISAALPDDPDLAIKELEDVEQLLWKLENLGGQDTKRECFLEVLRSVSQDGRAVLIFTEYADTLNYLRHYFLPLFRETLGSYSGEGGQFYDGNRWRRVTKDVITSALREGRLRALICTDAASEGLNLQSAGAVINYDLPWNPSKVEQRIGRVDRIGQKLREIRVINFFLENSVDQRVYALLRERCGLFEHFVGSMQPVLAAAQTMLLGKKPEDTEALRKLASDQDADPVVSQMFPHSVAEPITIVPPPVSRKEIIEALLDLRAEGIMVEASPNAEVLNLTIEGEKTAFAADTASLEADVSLTPVSPFHPLCRRLADSLEDVGERMPLIIGTAAAGAFRAASAWWAGGGKGTRIESMSEIRTCLASWDGSVPSSETWMAILHQAADETRRRVDEAKNAAVAIQKARLASQREAARGRLLLELGRFLVCGSDGVANLNDLFFQQMKRRDLATSARLERCFAKLGHNYPEWTADLIFEIERFRVEASQNQKLGRLIGSELDAALDDPRWNSTSA